MADNNLFITITAILSFLFEREETQLKDRAKSLLPRHAALGGSKDGYRHIGVVYTHLVGEARKRGTYDRLHPQLAPELDVVVAERKTMEADRDRIKQALALVLQDTRTTQDLRDALPNCMREVLPQCKGLERTREEAYTLVDNPRAFSQYMQIRDRIEFYVAARLLY